MQTAAAPSPAAPRPETPTPPTQTPPPSGVRPATPPPPAAPPHAAAPKAPTTKAAPPAEAAQPTTELTAKQVTAVLERNAALSKAPLAVRKLLAVAFGRKREPSGPALVVACLTDAASARSFLRQLNAVAGEDPFTMGAAVHAMDPSMRGRVWQSLVAVGAANGQVPKGTDMAVVRTVATALSNAGSLGEAITAALALL